MAQNKTSGRAASAKKAAPKTVKKEHFTSTDFAEVGSAGLSVNAGQITEDFLRQLQGRSGSAIFRDQGPRISTIFFSVQRSAVTHDSHCA